MKIVTKQISLNVFDNEWHLKQKKILMKTSRVYAGKNGGRYEHHFCRFKIDNKSHQNNTCLNDSEGKVLCTFSHILYFLILLSGKFSIVVQ